MARIQGRAAALGTKLKTEVFASRSNWQRYAMDQLLAVETIAKKVGLVDRLHLWPDKSLGPPVVANALGHPDLHLKFIRRWWNRISEWPQ